MPAACANSAILRRLGDVLRQRLARAVNISEVKPLSSASRHSSKV
jgi:hypothetical protein